jgi:hypothetical protein
MKTNNEKEFLNEIKDSFKSVLDKIDDFVEQYSNKKETKELFGNLEKANEIFKDHTIPWGRGVLGREPLAS